jgi:hypothetical protein
MKQLPHTTMTYGEVADTLEEFVDGRSGQWDWDGYMSATFFTDPYLKEVQQRMINLSDEFPAQKGSGFCSPEGLAVIRRYVEDLRAKASKLKS